MNVAVDLAIVGAGPAGCAAGILARQRGLTTVLFEARQFPRDRPGETLHPGVAPILRQLGVLNEVNSRAQIRPAAQITRWGGPARSTDYGVDQRGVWRAFQLLRAELDGVLLERYIALGGILVQPCPRLLPLVEHGVPCGVTGANVEVRARFTVDASGAAGFLRRTLGLEVERCSPPLIVHYGRQCGVIAAEPVLSGDATGWTWIAQVAPDLVSWARLDFLHGGERRTPPSAIAHLPGVGKVRAADVTWRITRPLAGPSHMITGEAAAVLDPAASHGVLRALMSGMMAAHQVAAVCRQGVDAHVAAHAYATWLESWFQRDLSSMRALYGRIRAPISIPIAKE
jgi:flavin-dependent dehydrogenase